MPFIRIAREFFASGGKWTAENLSSGMKIKMNFRDRNHFVLQKILNMDKRQWRKYFFFNKIRIFFQKFHSSKTFSWMQKSLPVTSNSNVISIVITSNHPQRVKMRLWHRKLRTNLNELLDEHFSVFVFCFTQQFCFDDDFFLFLYVPMLSFFLQEQIPHKILLFKGNVA